MTRGRVTDDFEEAREPVEGDLALLGSVRILMVMIAERVDMARKTGQTSALNFCGDDLQKCDRLINRVQIRIQKRYEEDLK